MQVIQSEGGKVMSEETSNNFVILGPVYEGRTDLIECNYQGRQYPIDLEIDWCNKTVSVFVNQLEGSVPMKVHHGLMWWITVDPMLNAQLVSSWLIDTGILRAINEQSKYFDTKWNGHNWIGTWEDYDKIMEFRDWLTDICMNIPAKYLLDDDGGIWDIYDYLGNCEEYNIKADTTDEELKTIADRIRSDAEEDDIVLFGNLEEYLKIIRIEKRSERENDNE